MEAPPGFDPSALDLSIDLDGNWRHQNEIITHPRVLAYLFANTKKMGPGYFFCAEGLCIPIELADCPYVVLSVRHTDEGITLLLTDGTRELLDPATLTIDAENIPRAKVKGGEHDVRFSRTAWMQLAEKIEEDGEGGYVLTVAGNTQPIETLI